jgi:PHP family Zn ribbon phosphoesterase
MRERLFADVGTEMEILHRMSREKLTTVVGEKIAGLIIGAREGKLAFTSGSGGSYGSIDHS